MFFFWSFLESMFAKREAKKKSEKKKGKKKEWDCETKDYRVKGCRYEWKRRGKRRV